MSKWKTNFCILFIVMATGLMKADTITWNVPSGAGGAWDTTSLNWTADAGGRNDQRYAEGDAVTFDGNGGGGTINLTTNHAPASVTVSGNSLYTFTGYGITNGTLSKYGAGTNALNNTSNNYFSAITLSGGELQWNDTGRLGTNQITVMSNSTLRSTKTTAVAYMNNSVITVSNGVTLDIWQHNPNNQGTTAATVSPISGGSVGSPITVNLRHPLAQGRVRLSTSDFIGSFYLRDRVLLENCSDNQFGNSNSVLYVVGGFETYSNPTIKRPVVIQGGYLSGIVFDGTVTNTGAPSVVGSVRFNNSASSLGGLYPNGGTIEFGFLPAGGSSRADGGGSAGVSFRFLGDLVGNASFGIGKNYDFSDGVANSRWLNLDVPSANADIRLTQAVDGYSAVRGGFRKDGEGALTLAANSTVFGALQVRAGRLTVNSTLGGVSNVTVQTGSTLGGTGTLSMASYSTLVTSNATLSPGGTAQGVGTLKATGGGTVIKSACSYIWDINAVTNDVLATAGLDFASLTGGTVRVRMAAGTTRKIMGNDPLVLFTYSGTLTGFNGAAWTVTLEQTGKSYVLTNPQVVDNGAGKVYLTGLMNTPKGTVMAIK